MQAWKKFIAEQETELGHETVEKWLKTLTVVHFDACNLYLEAKDAFHAIWFEEHIRAKVLSKLYNNNKKKIKVHLSIVNAPPKPKRPAKAKNVAASPAATFTLAFDQLDPLCTFKNYVVAENNQLPFKILSQICAPKKHSEGVETSGFNPIYLHGHPGSGKTHLLMATAAALREQGTHAIYAHAQTFTEHVVAAIRAGEMSLFRQAYRTSDLLIIDDIHELSRKGATQEEFFHTFNTLHLSGKQIILGANTPPGELQQIEPRLISRFEWGIVLPLDTPTKQDAEKIMQIKAETMGFPLHPKVMQFLLESFPSLLSLSKAFNALMLRTHLNESKAGQQQSKPSLSITVQHASQLLDDLLKEAQQNALTPTHIVQGVAEFFGIRPEDIFSSSRTRDCVLPRQISMHFCRHELKLPYVKIGDLFSKDHSTVMSSVKLIQQAIEAEDKEIADACRTIGKKLRSSEEKGH